MGTLRIDPLGVYNFYLTLLDSQSTGLGTLISAAGELLRRRILRMFRDRGQL